MPTSLNPVKVNLPDTASDDLRLGHFIKSPTMGTARIVLIGFPSDEGVRRNGGRIGAASAPLAIREALYKLTPDPVAYEQHCQLLNSTIDAGDIVVTGDLEHDQEVLARTVAAWLTVGAIPIILGGGHETAYGHFLGYVINNVPIHVINLDAHADVRPLKNGLAHSGSPFSQCLGHKTGLCQSYSVHGLAPWSVSRAHLSYLEKTESRFSWNNELSENHLADSFNQLTANTMVTFDMDVVDSCDAPGVSAPAVGGMAASLFFQAAYLAGNSPYVTSFDLVEVNPILDIDNKTSKTAAVAIWHFLKGVAARTT